MCPWIGPHAPCFGRQLWGLPSRVEYLSLQGVLLPLVYGTTASPLWLELRGLSAWQATPSWTVYRLACHWLLPWLRVTFAMVPDAAWPGLDQRPWGTAPTAGLVGWLGRPSASDPWSIGSFLSLGPPTSARVCGVLGHLASVHRCARAVRCSACAVSLATLLLFTGVPAWCVVLRVRCPRPLGSCSLVCPLGALLCVCGLLGHLAPVHRSACVVCCAASAVSWATWLLCTGAPAPCFALLLRCPGPLGSCSPVSLLGVLCCVCGVPGHLAPVHRCALCCVCGVLGHVAPVPRCARSVRCCAGAVSCANWLLFTSVLAPCAVLCVRYLGPLGSCSPVCPLRPVLCSCLVLGHLAPVHRCARSVCCVAYAVSWATWLLFTGVPAPCVAVLVRCHGPLGSCSPVCSLPVLCCVCGVSGHLALFHRCARSILCFARAVSWATGSCSPVCPIGVLCCVCGVQGHLAPVHRCARSVCCVARAVSLATWLLLTDVPARCVVLRVRCPGPPGSCSPVCSFGVPG